MRDLHTELGQTDSVLTLTADVADFEKVKDCVKRAEESLGPIDIVIANAGVAYHVSSSNLNEGFVKEMLDTNFLGVVHTVGAVAPLFVARNSGHIVGISSLTAYFASKHYAIYGATKAGMSAYLKAVRLELEPKGICVTTICPGFIRTPMTENSKVKMPFLLSVEDAARKIIESVHKRVEISNFPQPVFRSIQILNFLPKFLYKRVMKKWPI